MPAKVYKKNKKALVLMSAAVFAMTGGISSYAETTTIYLGGETHEADGSEISDTQGTTIYAYADSKDDSDYAPADGGNVTEEQISDKTIEYAELGTFIHLYNTTVQNMKSSSESKKGQYSTLKTEFVSDLWDSVKKAKDALSDGDSEAYNTYKSYENSYKAAIKSYNSVIEKLNSYGQTKSIKNTEKQLTSAAQSLMISYNTLKLNLESTETLCEYYKAIYDNTVLKKNAGSATDIEVEAAKAGYISAQSSKEQAKARLDEVYKNLCIILGLDENAGYTVADVPDPDTDYILSIDTDSDCIKAVNNSSSVQSVRHSKSSDSASYSVKEVSEQSSEDNAKISYNSAYNSLITSKEAYDAAKSVLNDTETDWKLAQSKYSMGMLSKAEFLMEQVNYLNGRAQYESARLGLVTSINTYKWMLEGIG